MTTTSFVLHSSKDAVRMFFAPLVMVANAGRTIVALTKGGVAPLIDRLAVGIVTRMENRIDRSVHLASERVEPSWRELSSRFEQVEVLLSRWQADLASPSHTPDVLHHILESQKRLEQQIATLLIELQSTESPEDEEDSQDVLVQKLFGKGERTTAKRAMIARKLRLMRIMRSQRAISPQFDLFLEAATRSLESGKLEVAEAFLERAAKLPKL